MSAEQIQNGADAALVAQRLGEVRDRIERAGGNSSSVRIIAVTKTFGLTSVRAALANGLFDLGENYAQELIEKAAQLASEPDVLMLDKVRWHFLGPIQRNKVGRLCEVVASFDAVDRLEEGAAIARHQPKGNLLLEVIGASSATRAGVGFDEVPMLVEKLMGLGLVVDGLMTIAPQGDLFEARVLFKRVRELVDRLGLKEASMGMSDDLEVAVGEGATAVRIGRALFGPRPAH